MITPVSGSSASHSTHSATSTSASLPVATKWLKPSPRSAAIARKYVPNAPLWLTMLTGPVRGHSGSK